MGSQNKNRKAKNSYLDGGAEKQHGIKMKRVMYFCKADRLREKAFVRKECN